VDKTRRAGASQLGPRRRAATRCSGGPRYAIWAAELMAVAVRRRVVSSRGSASDEAEGSGAGRAQLTYLSKRT
jgi:hypothetical protein